MATAPREAALGAGEEVASGMPQLDPSSYPNQIFWLIVALVAIYFVLSRVALPRISSVLAERQGTMTNDIAAAEELRQKAHEAERAYERALADARTEANRITEENRSKMQSELDRATEKAGAEIAAQQAESEKRILEIRDNAMSAVEEVAKETAVAVVSAMGFEGDRDQVEGAVEKRLKGAA